VPRGRKKNTEKKMTEFHPDYETAMIYKARRTRHEMWVTWLALKHVKLDDVDFFQFGVFRNLLLMYQKDHEVRKLEMLLLRITHWIDDIKWKYNNNWDIFY